MPGQIMAENKRDILTGISILAFCCAISLYFPVFGFICFLLLPLPVIFYRVKLGRRASGIMAALALAIIWILGAGNTVDIWMMLCMLGLGFAIGDFLEKDLSVEKTIAYPCAMVFVGGLAALFFIGSVSGSGPLEMASDYIRKNLEMTAAAYKNMDMPEKSIQLLTGSLDRVHYVLMRIMPALAAAGLIFSAWANLLLARMALSAGRLKKPFFVGLNRWQPPDRLVWAVIGCVLLAWAAGEPLAFIGINGLILLMLIYLFQGLAVVSFYFERKRTPMFLRVLIYAIIAMQQIFALVVISIGFFDTWADFRRLRIENSGSTGPY